MKQPISALIEKFMAGSLSRQERQSLRSAVSQMTDKELGGLLSALWEDYGHSMSAGRFEETIARPLGLMPRMRRRITPGRVGGIAAAVALPLLIGALVWFQQRAHTLDEFVSRSVAVNVASGEQATMTLPDGTRLNLNFATTLSYPMDFGLTAREVTLSGEAFFDVTKDAGKPFRVHTRHLTMQVLGTQFNVSAYDDAPTAEATLVEGSLRVLAAGGQECVLAPGQKATYDKDSGKMTLAESDGRFETAWTRGELVFRSVKFPDLMRKLEQRYGVTIRLVESNYSTDLFSGSFRDNSVYDVLRKLQVHYSFGYEQRNGMIYITPTTK